MSLNYLLHRKPLRAFYLASLLVFGSLCAADEKANIVVKELLDAYGGNKLNQIETMSLQDQFKTFRYGQSYSPDEVDIENNHVELFIDLSNKRKNFRWIMGDKNGYATRHWLFDGKDGYAISHVDKTIAKNNMLSFNFADRYHSHSIDTFIVKTLLTQQSTVSWLGEISYLGEVHDHIRFTLPTEELIELYINKKSGLLSFMQKLNDNPQRIFRYHFKGHTKQQGVVFAKQINVTHGGNPHMVITKRLIQFNLEPSNNFTFPTDYGESPASMDMSSMTVKKITQDVYFVGQDWGYSVFVDIGDGFIAAGGYGMLTERFDAVKTIAKVDKPLLKMVASHHHLDHVEGIPEAINLGAEIITVSQHVELLRTIVNAVDADQHFKIIENIASFADGKVMVIDLPNGHSTHNLMTYIPEAKMLFSADMYFSRQVDGVPLGGEHLQAINQKLSSLDITVDKFAASHSARILTAKDFEVSLNKDFEPVCPLDWSICQVMLND